MGLEGFIARRGISIIMHCIIPGSGFIIDAYDLIDTVQNAYDTGSISISDLKEIKDDIEAMRDDGKLESNFELII